mmetsp:Transcript_41025/g.68159  ORF Transcript_41025/g.68159 Transcript_41025/m.68159 type:complete len:204 (+) Transcript_41025:170-781(+)
MLRQGSLLVQMFGASGLRRPHRASCLCGRWLRICALTERCFGRRRPHHALLCHWERLNFWLICSQQSKAAFATSCSAPTHYPPMDPFPHVFAPPRPLAIPPPSQLMRLPNKPSPELVKVRQVERTHTEDGPSVLGDAIEIERIPQLHPSLALEMLQISFNQLVHLVGKHEHRDASHGWLVKQLMQCLSSLWQSCGIAAIDHVK